MEEMKHSKQKTITKSSPEMSKRAVWDCGSSLYDSFELMAVEKQLDAAIAASSRAMSLPHISDRLLSPRTKKKHPSKIKRSLRRMIRSVFRRKTRTRTNKNTTFGRGIVLERRKGGFKGVFRGKSGAICTTGEGPECDGVSLEICRPLVRKTASDRYSAATRNRVPCV